MSQELLDKFRNGEVAMVTWLDSCTSSEWHDADIQTYAPETCYSVGVIVRFDEHVIALAQSQTHGEQTCGVMTIPKAVIREVRYLKLPTPTQA